jgi:hypothetical protein
MSKLVDRRLETKNGKRRPETGKQMHHVAVYYIAACDTGIMPLRC